MWQLPTNMRGGNGKVAYIDTEGTLYPFCLTFVLTSDWHSLFIFNRINLTKNVIKVPVQF